MRGPDWRDIEETLECVRCALQGDEELTRLVKEYLEQQVIAILRRLTQIRSEEEREEFRGLCFDKVWCSLGTWRGDALLGTWVWTVCANSVNTEIKKKGRQRKREVLGEGRFPRDNDIDEVPSEEPEWNDPRSDTLQDVIGRELNDFIDVRLTPGQRMLWREEGWHVILDPTLTLPPPSRTGQSPGARHVRIHELRMRIMEILNEWREG